ncbi:hypothetical protein NFI96_015983 [Prochilodus magdalenae]|nr:hypothetical protein NFI96_015983 [Prochilodus magdalenae]
MMTDPNSSNHLLDFDKFYEEEFNYTDFLNITVFDVDKTTAPCQPFSMSGAINIAVCVFYTVIFLLAIPGNLIVGLVISSNRQSLSPSEVYLFHLMIADMLLALTLPFFATSVVGGWLFGDFMCKVISLVKEANFYTSILFLVCISMDRYMVIVRAMEARKAQRRMCSWAVCGGVWFFGFMLSLPALYNEAFSLKPPEPQICAERFELDSSEAWRLATRIMRHLLGFFLPLAFMLTCYCITIARLLRTRGFQRQKAMRVIVAVVAAFLLCWTPFHVATMVDTLLRAKVVENSCSKRNIVDVAMFATQSLGLLHCCVNPVLYAFVGQKFRNRFMQLLHRRRQRERISVSRSTRSTSHSAVFSGVPLTEICSAEISANGRSGRMANVSSSYEDYENYSSDVSPCSTTVESMDSIAIAVSYVIVFFFSVLGNSLVIYVVCLMKHRKASTDIYLMNLALADLLFSFTLPFWAVYVGRSKWVFGTFLCKLVSGVQETTFYSCVFLLACISIDRYMAIVKATQFISKQSHLVRTVCALVWLGAGMLSLPVMVQREALVIDSYTTMCYENMTAQTTDNWRVTLRILRHTLGFFIPLVVMLFCYGWTVGTLFRSRNSQKHKAMRVILCVVLAFVVCWLPNNIAEFIDTLLKGKLLEDTCTLRNSVDEAIHISQVLAFIHCAINPILYAFIGKKFRNQLLVSLFKKGLVGGDVLSRHRIGSIFSSGSSRHTSVTM